MPVSYERIELLSQFLLVKWGNH